MMHGNTKSKTFTVIEVKVQCVEQVTERMLNCSLENKNTKILYWFELIASRQLAMLLLILISYS